VEVLFMLTVIVLTPDVVVATASKVDIFVNLEVVTADIESVSVYLTRK
jgi:hypothetical protein